MSDEERSLQLKEEGNVLFRAGSHSEAIGKFNEALLLNPNSATLYCNRSACHAGLGQWKDSIHDAKRAVVLDSGYQKAYYRIVKGHLELGNHKDARLALLYGLAKCGEKKDLLLLEEQLFQVTGHPIRPKPHDFEIIDELGTGNFTTVLKAKHRKTGTVYAIKVKQS